VEARKRQNDFAISQMRDANFEELIEGPGGILHSDVALRQGRGESLYLLAKCGEGTSVQLFGESVKIQPAAPQKILRVNA